MSDTQIVIKTVLFSTSIAQTQPEPKLCRELGGYYAPP